MRRLFTVFSRKATFVAILAAAVVAVIAEIARNIIAGTAALSSSFINIFMLIALLLVFAQLGAMRTSVEQLSRKARFAIVYYPASNKQEVSALHLAAKQVIERAPRNAEIYAVNSYIEVFRESNDPAAEESQRDYLLAYERRFDNLAKYHRLIQLKNGQHGSDRTKLGDRLAPAYLAHYRAMADHAKRNRPIKLERVEARLPTSFVVVKNGGGGEIIWQMNHRDPGSEDNDVERMEGVFIVNDPDGLLVHRFIDWFNALDTGWRSPVPMENLT